MSDDLRDLIVASADSPSKRLDTAAMLARARAQRLRRRVGGFFATVSIAALAVVVATAVADTSVNDDNSRRSRVPAATLAPADYDLSNATLEETGLGSATVRFSLAWDGNEFPGIRDCTISVYGPAGALVGERTIERVFTLRPDSATLSKDVPVEGRAESTSVVCTDRLDDPNGRYRISDVRTSRVTRGAGELLVTVDSQWAGTTREPGIAVCAFEVVGTQGTVLVDEETTFWHEGAAVEDVPVPFSVAEGLDEQPASTDVECRPYEQPLS